MGMNQTAERANIGLISGLQQFLGAFILIQITQAIAQGVYTCFHRQLVQKDVPYVPTDDAVVAVTADGRVHPPGRRGPSISGWGSVRWKLAAAHDGTRDVLQLDAPADPLRRLRGPTEGEDAALVLAGAPRSGASAATS